LGNEVIPIPIDILKRALKGNRRLPATGLAGQFKGAVQFRHLRSSHTVWIALNIDGNARNRDEDIEKLTHRARTTRAHIEYSTTRLGDQSVRPHDIANVREISTRLKVSDP
jgi:hypothetical protein